jgi:hypothetical protein
MGEMMSDDYLVMHRVMEREWQSWYKENVLRTNPTGIELLKLKRAYNDAFMAGFLLKFTKGEET